MENLAKFLRGALAAAAGGAAGIFQRRVSEGTFDLTPQHFKAAGIGALVALLMYLARSPLTGAPQTGIAQKEKDQ